MCAALELTEVKEGVAQSRTPSADSRQQPRAQGLAGAPQSCFVCVPPPGDGHSPAPPTAHRQSLRRSSGSCLWWMPRAYFWVSV
jgi:hypothetical protein